MATRSHNFSTAANAVTGPAVSLDAGVDTLTINVTTSRSSVYTSTPFDAPYAGHEISVIRVIETVPGNDSISTGSGSATVTYSPTSSGSGTIKVEEKVWRAIDEGFGITYGSIRSTKTYQVSVTIAAAANAPTDFTTNPVWDSTANANSGAISYLTTSPVANGTSPITYSFSEAQSHITISSSTGAVTWLYGNTSTSTQSVTVTATATNSTGSYSENFTVTRKRGPGLISSSYSWPNASWTAQTESVSGTASYVGTEGTWSTSNSGYATINTSGTLSWNQNSSTSSRSVTIYRQVTENGYTRSFSVGSATQFGRPADYVSVDSFSVTSEVSEGGTYNISGSISEFDLSDSTTGTYTITRGSTEVASGNVGETTTSVSHTGLAAPTTYGSYTYTINVTVGSLTNSATATQYVIDRPATPTVTSDNPRSANVTVTVSSSKNGSGTLEYAQSSSTSIPSSGWQTSTTFTQARNTTRYYFVRNKYGSGAAYPSGTKYASKVVNYISPDTAVTATSSVLTNGATDSATTTIAGGQSDEVYAVRVNNGSTNLATRTGNGDITFAPDVGVGDSKTFEIFAKVPTDKGGSNAYSATNDTFTVKRQVLAPTAVSASHNDAASASVTVTVSATITAQRQGSGTLQYAQSTTNSAPSTGWQNGNTFTQSRNTTRYYWTRVTSTVNTATYNSSASVTVGYRTPDTAVAATSSTISNTATSATTTISNATGGETYAVRVNNGSTNLATRVGNGNVSFTSSLPTAGTSKTYEIFSNRPTNIGGDGGYDATNDTFTVSREIATPGTPSVSHNNADSSTVTATIAAVAITGATVTYAVSSTNSRPADNLFTSTRAYSQDRGTTRYYWVRAVSNVNTTYSAGKSFAVATDSPTATLTAGSSANANANSTTTVAISNLGGTVGTVTENKSYTTVSRSGNTVTVTFTSDNTSTSARSSTVTVPVTRNGVTTNFTVNVSQLGGPSVSGTYSYTEASATLGGSSVSGSPTFTGTASTWSVVGTGASINTSGNVSWSNNTSTSSRSATVYRVVTRNGLSRTLAVGTATQSGLPDQSGFTITPDVTQTPGGTDVTFTLSGWNQPGSANATHTLTIEDENFTYVNSSNVVINGYTFTASYNTAGTRSFTASVRSYEPGNTGPFGEPEPPTELGTAEATASVEWLPVIPVASFASGPTSVNEGTQSTFTATTDSKNAYYNWSLEGNTSSASISSGQGTSSVVINNGEVGRANGSYTLRLRTTSVSTDYREDTRAVTVNFVNVSPVVSAGFDNNNTLRSNGTVGLNTSATDADNDTLTFNGWSIVSGGGSLTSSTSANLAVYKAPVVENNGTVVLRASWSDPDVTITKDISRTYLGARASSVTITGVADSTPNENTTDAILASINVLDGVKARSIVWSNSGAVTFDPIPQTTNVLAQNFPSWSVGTGSSTGYGQNGDGNSRKNDTNPYGETDVVWDVSNQDSASNADGGWNSSYFSVDPSKTYRFSVWVRRKVRGNGHFYFGVYGRNSSNTNIGVGRTSGGSTGNHYFEVNTHWDDWPDYTTDEDQWYLVVAHMHPIGYTGSNHADTGVYNINGEKVHSGMVDGIWLSGTVKAQHRTYLYYSTNTSTNQQWWDPRVEVVGEGSPPTIASLLPVNRTVRFSDVVQHTAASITADITDNLDRAYSDSQNYSVQFVNQAPSIVSIVSSTGNQATSNESYSIVVTSSDPDDAGQTITTKTLRSLDNVNWTTVNTGGTDSKTSTYNATAHTSTTNRTVYYKGSVSDGITSTVSSVLSVEELAAPLSTVTIDNVSDTTPNEGGTDKVRANVSLPSGVTVSSYLWSFTSGSNAASYDNTSIAEPTITFGNVTENTTVVAKVSVTDSLGRVFSDTQSFTVQFINQSPTVAGTPTTTNASPGAGSSYTISGSGSDVDASGSQNITATIQRSTNGTSWTDMASSTATGTSTTASVSYVASAGYRSGNQIYYYRTKVTDGIATVYSGNRTVTEQASSNITVTISGDSAVNENLISNYATELTGTSAGVTISSYTWSVTNGTVVEGAGTSEISIEWNDISANTTATIDVTIVDSLNRTFTGTKNVAVSPVSGNAPLTEGTGSIGFEVLNQNVEAMLRSTETFARLFVTGTIPGTSTSTSGTVQESISGLDSTSVVQVYLEQNLSVDASYNVGALVGSTRVVSITSYEGASYTVVVTK
jgi:hypothetical protein